MCSACRKNVRQTIDRAVKNLASFHVADYAFVALFAIVFVIGAFSAEVFFSRSNLTNLLRQIVANGLVSLGMLLVILTGGIDLTVGSYIALGGVLYAGLADTLGIWPALILATAAGAAAGVLNGILVAYLKLQAFIVTLATMGILRGVVYVITETPLVAMHPAFRLLGAGSVGPFSFGLIIMLGAYILIWFFLNHMHAGRSIIAIGGNQEAVRLAGINTSAMIVFAYILSGFFSTLSGAILVSRLGIAQPSLGIAYELDAIAACVIGGAILGGGGGGVIGAAFGVLTLGLINNLMNLFGVQSYYQQIVRGTVIVFAVLARRRRR